MPLSEGDTSVIDTLRLTAEDAAALIERGEVSAAELHGAYSAREDGLHAYLLRVDEAFANAPDRKDDFFRVPAK